MVRNRVQTAWRNFTEMSGMLCRKSTSLKQKGELYNACVRSVLENGAECWALKTEGMRRLESAERRMLRMMCGVTLMDRVRSEEIRERVGVECIPSWVKRQRLWWLGHVERREESGICKTMYMKV